MGRDESRAGSVFVDAVGTVRCGQVSRPVRFVGEAATPRRLFRVVFDETWRIARGARTGDRAIRHHRIAANRVGSAMTLRDACPRRRSSKSDGLRARSRPSTITFDGGFVGQRVLDDVGHACRLMSVAPGSSIFAMLRRRQEDDALSASVFQRVPRSGTPMTRRHRRETTTSRIGRWTARSWGLS